MEQSNAIRLTLYSSKPHAQAFPTLPNNIWAPLKTVLFRDGGVSRVLKSSCIRPYTPVFRTRLPCPHKKCRVFRGAHITGRLESQSCPVQYVEVFHRQ